LNPYGFCPFFMCSGFRVKGKRCAYRTYIGCCHEWTILFSQNARNRECQNWNWLVAVVWLFLRVLGIACKMRNFHLLTWQKLASPFRRNRKFEHEDNGSKV